MSKPLVSVVIAAYNAGSYLCETLDSALAQTFRQHEIIVIDDGSTDTTTEVIRPYLPYISYSRCNHQGLAGARNAGLRCANGEFIALLDADDVWLPEKLEVQVEVAIRNTCSGLIACDGIEFDGKSILGSTLLPTEIRNRLQASPLNEVTINAHHDFIGKCLISCPAQTLIPRRVIQQIGPFADYLSQDYDYYLRVSKRYPVTFHGHSLARWRYSSTSMSGPHDVRWQNWTHQMMQVLEVHALRCEGEERSLVRRRLIHDGFWLTRDRARKGTGPRTLRRVIGFARAFLWLIQFLLRERASVQWQDLTSLSQSLCRRIPLG